MGLSFSLLLAGAGAVLIWAVNATVGGINIQTVGVILLIVGIIGFAVSLFFWSSWGGFGARTAGAGSSTVVTERHSEPQVLKESNRPGPARVRTERALNFEGAATIGASWPSPQISCLNRSKLRGPLE